LKFSRLAVTAGVTAFFAFPLYLISENGGAEPGHTGGPFPGERSCGRSDCHNVTPNTGPGRVFITTGGLPLDQYVYTPGETVRLRVRVEDPDQGRWGFQLTARNSNDGCQSEGTLVPADGETRVESAVPVGPCAGPQFATHVFPKVDPGGQQFEVDWTAPATDVGPITFAVAGNAANGNNLSTGDRIYTSQATVGGPGQAPSIGEGGIILGPGSNGAPIQASAAPLSILSVFGQNFAPDGTLAFQPQLDESGRVSTLMAGVCVEIGGQGSPMLAVTPNQVNLQASDQIGLGPQSVVVVSNCNTLDEIRSQPQMVDFAATVPGFFVFPQFGAADGANPIAALHGGGPDVVAPAGLFQDTVEQTFSPAASGEFISLFATGLGETEPALEAGEIPQNVLDPANPTAPITGNATVTIGGVPLAAADIFYAGVAPCCAGLYQLVVKVPESLQAGDHPVIVTVDGVSSPPGPFIPVR
jgi:uncharacterized protein (TIGR03437 family)